MTVLLTALNAKYIHTCPAVYSLKAYADRFINETGPALPGEVHIRIAEYTINQRYQDILSGIMSYQPDIIGFSTYIWNVDTVRRLIHDIRMIKGPDIQIWAGGPEASYYPESFLGPQGADLCMLGEGEETFTRILGRHARKLSVKTENIKGLAYVPDAPAYGGSAAADEQACGQGASYRHGIVNTGLADPVDISRIPFLYHDLTMFSDRIIYYESSRGCPFSCAYCLSGREKGIRYRDIRTVFNELSFFMENKVRQVKFVDRTFNADPSYAMQIWRYIRDHDNGVTNFHFEIEGERMTDEQLDLLSGLRPGLIQMEIGVQSVNPDTLKSVHRNPDIKRIQEIMPRLSEKQNINLHLDLIAGLPYEDMESFRNSFNTVYAMRPHQFQVGFLKLLKGTDLYDRREEFGLVCSEHAPYEVLKTRWMSYEDLHLIHSISDVVDDYSSSQGFTGSLPYAEKLFPDAFTMFKLLADYYSRHGYDLKKPSHAGRYEIFISFLREYAQSSGRHDMQRIDRMIEMVRFDQALHMHPSRKMEREDVFDLPYGKVRVHADHRHCSPVNGKADHEILEYIKPRILLGTWAWGSDGTFGDSYSEDDLAPVYEEAGRCGLNCWDTAYVYGMGRAEKILGSLMADGKDRPFISAKFTPYHADEDRESAVYDMFSKSCSLLGVGRLDIYWMHTPDSFDRWIGSLIDLYRKDKIGSIGLSNFNLQQIIKADRILKAEGIKTGGIQNHYSIVCRTSEQTGILDFCKENDIPFYSYMILEQGALTGRYTGSAQFPEGSARWKNYRKIMDRFERVNSVTASIAEDHKASPAQILTAWAISKGTIPIIGVTKPDQVRDAYNASQIILAPEEICRMETAADSENIRTRRIWEP